MAERAIRVPEFAGGDEKKLMIGMDVWGLDGTERGGCRRPLRCMNVH
jgi:hypothetical protein